MIQPLYVAFLRDAVSLARGASLPADHPLLRVEMGNTDAVRVALGDAVRRLHAGAFGSLSPAIARATEAIVEDAGLARTMRPPRTALAALRPGALPALLKRVSPQAVPGILTRFFTDLRAVAHGTVDAPAAPSVLEDVFVDFLSRVVASACDQAMHGSPVSLLPGTRLGKAVAAPCSSAASARSLLSAIDAFFAARRPTLTALSPTELGATERVRVRAQAPTGSHVRFSVNPHETSPLRLFFAGRTHAVRRS